MTAGSYSTLLTAQHEFVFDASLSFETIEHVWHGAFGGTCIFMYLENCFFFFFFMDKGYELTSIAI